MKLIENYQKLSCFAGATKKTTTVKVVGSKTKTKSTKAKKDPSEKAGPTMSGTMTAVGPVEEVIVINPETGKKSKVPVNSKKKSKWDKFFEESNKYGMIAISTESIVNHAVNTALKVKALHEGNDWAYREYEERAKNYMKPHFALPSQWFQSRITFGTPWFY